MKSGKLGIFGGTSEGRLLAELCREQEIPAVISVATFYGEQLLEEGDNLSVCTGRMNREEMCQWMEANGIAEVIDATHPFAKLASENIRQACRKQGISYHRLVRDKGRKTIDRKNRSIKESDISWVQSVEEAALFLKEELSRYPKRKALLTTGSKELFYFAGIAKGEGRIYARVLPSADGILACQNAGISGKQILALQGPFSYELNRAILQDTGVSYLVTKESGEAGGFSEKLKAAVSLGCHVIAVGRPEEEQGESFQEIRNWLLGIRRDCLMQDENLVKKNLAIRKVSLVGIGMGNPEQMTLEGIQAVLKSDGILGASRMVESGKNIWKWLKQTGWITAGEWDNDICTAYAPEKMLSWLDCHPDIKNPVILYSGDVGFYSGAAALLQKIQKENRPYTCRLIPGISSLAYFGGRLGRSWEHVKTVSLHGRKLEDTEEEEWSFQDKRERFLLLDGTKKLYEVCRILKEQGQAQARIWIGERLSYEDERIFCGTPDQLLKAEIDSLSVAWIIPN